MPAPARWRAAAQPAAGGAVGSARTRRCGGAVGGVACRRGRCWRRQRPRPGRGRSGWRPAGLGGGRGRLAAQAPLAGCQRGAPTARSRQGADRRRRLAAGSCRRSGSAGIRPGSRLTARARVRHRRARRRSARLRLGPTPSRAARGWPVAAAARLPSAPARSIGSGSGASSASVDSGGRIRSTRGCSLCGPQHARRCCELRVGDGETAAVARARAGTGPASARISGGSPPMPGRPLK